jgi:cell division septal protein FtsQ
MAIQKRGTTRKINQTKTSRRTVNRKKDSGALTNFFVPLFFIIGILFCLGFLSFMGFKTMTASAFFDVKAIDVRGINRIEKNEIERIVRSQAEKSGVWNANLNEIKIDVEKLTLVKSAVVSRILPDGLRVSINERVPQAVVRMDAGDFWADEEAVILSSVGKDDAVPSFVLRGWDAAKNEKAAKENKERVKIYLKMLDEWKEFDIAKRITAVDLTDLRTPQAIVSDSGEQVTIVLPKGNFGKPLKTGLERIAGRGKEVASIDVSGTQPFLGFRNKQ